VFRIGGNIFYNRKNKIPMKITEFKRYGIGLIAEFCEIPNGFPNQGENGGSGSGNGSCVSSCGGDCNGNGDSDCGINNSDNRSGDDGGGDDGGCGDCGSVSRVDGGSSNDNMAALVAMATATSGNDGSGNDGSNDDGGSGVQ
jgi:hypothetical protein